MTITVKYRGRRWTWHKGWATSYWESDKGNIVMSSRLKKQLNKLALLTPTQEE